MKHRAKIHKAKTPAVALGCLLFAGLALWAGGKSLHASNWKPNQADRFRARLQAGVGTQISFAQTASADAVRASVDSIDRFIAGRSGLSLDPASKEKLVQMESETLGSQRSRVSTKAYVNALTDTLLERMSSLTDDEIDYASSSLKNNGRISLRFNGRFGISDDEFPVEARKLREQSRSGDASVRSAIRDGVSQEVEKRMGALSDAVPAQFGVVNRHGLTPAQALLVTYSVITDDDLTLTQKQISSLAKNPALPSRAADGTIPENAKVYGPNGRFFATPADLVFNGATINSLLDRLAKGGN